MSRSILAGAAVAIALTAAAPFVPAMAQGDADRADSSSITVYSPLRVENHRSPGGMTERTLTSSSAVYYDDLNLRTQWGRDQLDDRIKLAAEQTCDYLDDLYPLDSSSTSSFDCVKKAVRDARPQVYLAVANFDGGYAYNDY
jgi:UrcA family protein